MGDIVNHLPVITMTQDTRPVTSPTSPVNRVQRVRHELHRRDLQVVRVEPVGPGFRRITFAGESLAGFVSASFDDHVKLFLDPADGTEPVRRDYTPRRFEAAAGELSIEFALHGDGPAANWAAQATPGQRATIGGPRGSFIIPTDFDWHLLVGDETALPAIARRLEELPAGTQVFVVLHVENPADAAGAGQRGGGPCAMGRRRRGTNRHGAGAGVARRRGLRLVCRGSGGDGGGAAGAGRGKGA